MHANRYDCPLRQLVRRHRGRLLLTYLLFAVETVVELLQPLAIGWAVEAFLTGRSGGLALFALQQFATLSLGVIRRFWDARFFNRVAAELAEELVLVQRAAGVEVSSVAARAGLSNQIVNFLERDLPFIGHCVVQGIGTIVMLTVVAPNLLPISMALLIPSVMLSWVYAGYSHRNTARLHDEMERTVDVVGGGDTTEVRDHFLSLSGTRQSLSRAEAAYFGVWQVFGLGFLALIFVLDPNPGRTAGEWTAILGYARLLLTTLVNVPRLIDQLNRLRDIGGRLNTRMLTPN